MRRDRLRPARGLAAGAALIAILAATLATRPAPGEGTITEAAPIDIATPPAPRFDPMPPEEFPQLVTEIADWIVAHSDYAARLPLPAFLQLPRLTLNDIFHSQMVGGWKGQDCINALHVPHLLLAEDLDTSACSDTLVHEMVHHFQFVTGWPFRCTPEAERDAYTLQALWSAQTGACTPPCRWSCAD